MGAARLYPAAMPKFAKTTQLQIRVSPAEKAAIQRAARRADMDMSAYVLACMFPAQARRFTQLIEACRATRSERFALAELNGWLATLSPSELRDALGEPPTALARLTPFVANYVAAMVEYACAARNVASPAWTRTIVPLPEPAFGTTLASLRLHLLTRSPAPFRRRNVFIDATVGAQV
jgi:uncharacterized protein (DUF1778 family)